MLRKLEDMSEKLCIQTWTVYCNWIAACDLTLWNKYKGTGEAIHSKFGETLLIIMPFHIISEKIHFIII